MAKNPHAVALGRLGGLVQSEAKIRAARANGKLAGLVRSEARARAARENGKLGGRPRGKGGKHGGGRPKKFINWQPALQLTKLLHRS